MGLTGDINDVMNAHNLAMVALTARMQHERNYSDEQLARLTRMRRLDVDPPSSELMAILAIVRHSEFRPHHVAVRAHVRLDAQRHQPHAVQHGRVSACHGARRPIRQHRRRAVFDHRRPARPEVVRLSRHGERLRRRHRLREILERQVPLQR